MTPPVKAALANALRKVNASFANLAPQSRDALAVGFDSFDRRLDDALVSGPEADALSAIREFEQHWLHKIGGAK